MRTFTIFMWHLPLLLVAACGDDARALAKAGPMHDAGADSGSPPPDARPDAPPDAPSGGMPGSLDRLDWRTTRGAPIATSAVNLPTATLFSVSGDSFVTQSECQNTPGCAFIWRDLAGTPGMRRDHMARITSFAISPDGNRAQLAALDAIESCNDGQSIFQVGRGALQLLDLATGAASFELPIRSNFWSTQGFTPLSDWFFAAPIKGTACSSSSTGFLSATSPFAPSPGLDATDELVRAVDARRWVVMRGGAAIGLTDPLTPGSFQSLSGTDPDPFFDVTQGWVHVYLGFADLAEDVVSIPPSGPMRHTAPGSDEDWHSFGARGRWIRVCGLPTAVDGYRNCRVIDGQGQVAPADFRITFALDRPDDAVLLGSGAVVFVGPAADGSRAVQRLVFATGQREILHPGDGKLRSLGDGTAALLLQDGAAWLIEAGREELVADHVSQVLSVPQIPTLGRAPGRQDDVAVLALSSSTGQVTLAALDVHTRRLATLTDNPYFTPPPQGSTLGFGDGCGQPWTTRTAGSVIEGIFQQPKHLYFVEQGTPATLWLLPIDLSAPPRRLAQLAGDPASCHAPLASPDGSRVGFAENSADGTTTRITLSAEK